MDPFALDPAKPPPPLMERAYQLASSGKFATVEDICIRLISDGYENVYLHFECRAATRSELLRICRKAQSAGAPRLRTVAAGEEGRRRARWRRFELQAAECRHLAERAVGDETRELYLRLADTYDRLAKEANANEAAQNKTGAAGSVSKRA